MKNGLLIPVLVIVFIWGRALYLLHKDRGTLYYGRMRRFLFTRASLLSVVALAVCKVVDVVFVK